MTYPIFTRYFACLLISTICAAANADVLLNIDFEDGTTAGLGTGNTIISNATDPVEGDLALAVDNSMANFVNVNTGNIAITPSSGVIAVNASVEYLFPSDTVGNAGDNLFFQLQFRDANGVTIGGNNNVGFITFDPNNPNFVADTWRTLSFTELAVPAGATQVFTLLISGNDGGDAGTAYYVDNWVIESVVSPIPEPSSAALIGMILGVAALRRRK